MIKYNLKLLSIISLLAMTVSFYLLYLHYDGGSGFCDFTESFNCYSVNTSVYSQLEGVVNYVFGSSFSLPIPTALLSIIVFLFIFLSSFSLYKEKRFFGISEFKLIKILKILFLISLAYALFLLYIEAFVLKVWCVFCLILDGFIVLGTVLIFSKKRLKLNFE
jgi:uncharacterized membrane protein